VPVPYSAVMTKLKALLVSLLMALGLAAFAAPAVAAPVTTAPVTAAQAIPFDCEPSGTTHLFCLYRSWDYQNNQPAVWSEGYFESNPRNTCIPLQTFDDASFWNDTRFVWWEFNTTTCNGTHYTAYPHTAAQIFPTGGRHAVMRTALLSKTGAYVQRNASLVTSAAHWAYANTREDYTLAR
jgi:hypothetical protein